VVLMLYAPIDFPLIEEIINKLKNIAGKFNLKNEFGFITPLDNGRDVFLNMNYYFDNNNGRRDLLVCSKPPQKQQCL